MNQPTDLPAAGRFTKSIPIPTVPTDGTLPVVFRAAARLIARNGLHQGDYVADVFDRATPAGQLTDRPLSIVAAVRCVTTGLPYRCTAVTERAIAELADHLVVDGEHAPDSTPLALELHVERWGDHAGRTTESAVAMLEHAADRHEGEWTEMRYQLGHFDADAACRATVDFRAVA